MVIIGLTGNIASGKSTVSRRLKMLGAKVIDADQTAREVVRPGEPALNEIVEHFGPGVLDNRGELDRKKMGSIIFSDPGARKKLNEITHPRIKEAIYREIERTAIEGGYNIVVIEAPLLIEVQLHRDVDEVWMVKIDQEEQIKRLAERDKLSREEALQRIKAQMPQEEKIKHAHRVIDNSGSNEETIRQIDLHWSALLKEHFI